MLADQTSKPNSFPDLKHGNYIELDHSAQSRDGRTAIMIPMDIAMESLSNCRIFMMEKGKHWIHLNDD